jgi:hypothetical protein
MIVASVLRNVDEAAGWFRIDENSMEFVGGVALNIFLVVALMDLKIWQLAGQALPLFMILLVQLVVLVLLAYVASFRLMGRDYDSAVMASGFIGFAMGTTANAVANMRALVGRFGPAPRAFLVIRHGGVLHLCQRADRDVFVNWRNEGSNRRSGSQTGKPYRQRLAATAAVFAVVSRAEAGGRLGASSAASGVAERDCVFVTLPSRSMPSGTLRGTAGYPGRIPEDHAGAPPAASTSSRPATSVSGAPTSPTPMPVLALAGTSSWQRLPLSTLAVHAGLGAQLNHFLATGARPEDKPIS